MHWLALIFSSVLSLKSIIIIIMAPSQCGYLALGILLFIVVISVVVVVLLWLWFY